VVGKFAPGSADEDETAINEDDCSEDRRNKFRAGERADPGVVDVSTSWIASLPKPMLELLKSGRKAEFDGFMLKTLDPVSKSYLDFRMRPFGFASYYDTFKAVMTYNLSDVAGKIRCPLLITEPANEAYWPGQSRLLYDLVSSPKKLVHFSESDGADLHCEPKGTGLRDLRVFDWLDETLRSSSEQSRGE
jgi:hypothetical protein